MCGIVGQWRRDREGRVETADIKRMCDAIVHRGPDDEGLMACGPIGLGMRRLSIIDLAGGHQPMTSDDGRLTIVFNGEIYNYREIRHELEQAGCRFRTASDTECILHAYARSGADCLARLNGMFAVAIWDAQARSLFLARDRVGIKPLYLHEHAGGLAFASEIKALLTDPAVPRRLDHEGFRYFLRYGYVPSPATLLHGISQLPPAHYLYADERGVRTQRYWSLAGVEPQQRPEADVREMVFDELRRAVDRQMVSDVPLGAFLSGGLDSTSMVHLMSELTGAPVNTYSIGFAGADTFHNELDDARDSATRYGTRHHEIIVRPDAADLIPKLVDHLDQPLADSSFIVTYLVSTLARETVKVIISGVGGDELFGGYRRYLGPYLAARAQAVPRPVRGLARTVTSWLPVDRGSTAGNYARLARSFLAAQDLSPYDRYDVAVQLQSTPDAQRLAPAVASGASDLFHHRHAAFEEVSANDPVGQMLRLDFHTSLVDSLLLLTDKMSMATSLEARVPFLDHELVEKVAGIPSSLKVKGRDLRYIQKRSMKGRLPEEVFRRAKRGFGCPVGAWFRHDLRPLLRETLSPARLAADGLFDPARVEQTMAEHETFKEDRTDLLLALLTFQLWRDRWRISA